VISILLISFAICAAALAWYLQPERRARRMLRIARDKSLPIDVRLRATQWLILRGWGPEDGGQA